ncbi:hypothetical protein IJT17_02345 [bacterium]|nr:hypothetical protein [bacterium]
MKKIFVTSGFVGLVLGSALLFPQVCHAELYQREGGTAFHTRRDCPTLKGYKVVTIEHENGLQPCRVCDKLEYDRRQAAEKSAAEAAERRKLAEQQAAARPAPPAPTDQPGYDQNAAGGYYNPPPVNNPDGEESRLHGDGQGVFVVSNGQKIYVDNAVHNIERADNVIHNGGHPNIGPRR